MDKNKYSNENSQNKNSNSSLMHENNRSSYNLRQPSINEILEENSFVISPSLDSSSNKIFHR